LAQAHVARGVLVPLFDGWSLEPMSMFVVFPSNRNVSAKLRVFIDWVVEVMALHTGPAISASRVTGDSSFLGA
jgi:DNA-binding transcriptional LysR family regulator